MSKIDISLNLKASNSDCDQISICQAISGADGGDIKKETVELAASSNSTIFTGASTDKIIYLESDTEFQVDINGLGPVSVKPFLAGSKKFKALYLSKLTVTSIQILNPSATDTIKVSYLLA